MVLEKSIFLMIFIIATLDIAYDETVTANSPYCDM